MTLPNQCGHSGSCSVISRGYTALYQRISGAEPQGDGRPRSPATGASTGRRQRESRDPGPAWRQYKMPVCWITGCKYTPGRVQNGHEIKLHSFPNSLPRIKEWLLEMGQNFKDIDNVARQILDNKQRKCNKFRLCSLHFSDNSFIVNVCGRTLRPNAVPTIFDNVPFNSEKVNEDLSLRKTFKRKREQKTSLCAMTSPYPSLPLSIKSEDLDDFPLYTASAESEIENCSIGDQTIDPSEIIAIAIKSEVLDDLQDNSTSVESVIESSDDVDETEKTKSHQDAQTQTEFTFKNSIIYLLDNDFLTGNPAIDPCGPPYCSLQNPIVALNCLIQAPGRNSLDSSAAI